MPRKKKVVAPATPTVTPIQQMQNMLATVPTEEQQALLRALSYTHSQNLELNRIKKEYEELKTRESQLMFAIEQAKAAKAVLHNEQIELRNKHIAEEDKLQALAVEQKKHFEVVSKEYYDTRDARLRVSKSVINMEDDLAVDALYHKTMESNL